MEQHSLKLKLLDSFYDMVTTKKSNLPFYHGNDSKEFVPAYTAENKKVCNPLVADINLPSTHDFIRSLSEDKKVGLAGIAILKDGKLVAEHYVPPYGAGYRHVSFSMCKSVTSMAVGLAMEEGLLKTFIEAGAVVSTPTCGPCLGGYMGVLAEGERCVSTTNRNFVGRMGHVKSEVYLASPAVAAASAVAGQIACPEQLD